MRRLFLVAACAAMAAASMEAKNGRSVDVNVSVVFRPEDRQVIVDYYRVNPSNLPPGLAKRGGDLPPGLAKQLQRNGRLPRGLDKRVTPFPASLERRLPPLPVGVFRGILGDQAVIYEARTRAILDVTIIIGGGR